MLPVSGCLYRADALPRGAERGLGNTRRDLPQYFVVLHQPPARLRGTELIEQAGERGLALHPCETFRGRERHRRRGREPVPRDREQPCLLVGRQQRVETACRRDLTHRLQVTGRVGAGDRAPVKAPGPAAPAAQGERVTAHRLDPNPGRAEHRQMLARRQARRLRQQHPQPFRRHAPHGFRVSGGSASSTRSARAVLSALVLAGRGEFEYRMAVRLGNEVRCW